MKQFNRLKYLQKTLLIHNKPLSIHGFNELESLFTKKN